MDWGEAILLHAEAWSKPPRRHARLMAAAVHKPSRSRLFRGLYLLDNGEVQAWIPIPVRRAARIRPPPPSLARLYRQLLPKVRLPGPTKLPDRYGGDGAEQQTAAARRTAGIAPFRDREAILAASLSSSGQGLGANGRIQSMPTDDRTRAGMC
jgi:hypothetical protein